MHLDRGIVHTYRRSDGLFTRPDDQNTITRQSSDTSNTPRDLASADLLHCQERRLDKSSLPQIYHQVFNKETFVRDKTYFLEKA